MASLVYRLLPALLYAASVSAHIDPRGLTSLESAAIRARQLTKIKYMHLRHSQATRRQTGGSASPSSVPGGDDDDWLDDYTYDEAELPIVFTPKPASDDSDIVENPPPVDVVDFPESPPENDGTTQPDLITEPPTPVCMIDPENSEHDFNLIDVGQNLLTGKNGRVGRLVDEDFAGYTEEQLENYKPPTFIFTRPPNGPAGFYDLVSLSGGLWQYIGRASNGDAVVVSQSSNGQTPISVDGVEVVTTLFTVNCQGYISTGLSTGLSYVWSTDSTYATLAIGTASKDNSVFTVPSRAPPPATAEQRRRAERSGVSRRDPLGSGVVKRHPLASYSDGAAPRCPNWPRDLWANDRPGARDYNPNGCGSGATSSWVPQFNFRGCCNDHDDCFDNCYRKRFEWCNDDFTNCMVNGICGQISWWHPIDKINCKAAGYFYGWVVSSWPGQIAFYSANSDRCQCNCPVGLGYCGYANNCLDLQNDNNNCGQCNRNCPNNFPNTHCSGGGCACNSMHGYCGGNGCIPLTTNQNCGGCGRQCPDDMHCDGTGNCVCNANIWGNDDNNCGACRRRCANGHSCRGGQCVCTADIMNDSNHCGGCGNVCPRGTRCGGGQCVCANNQCGNLCLDFQTHPRNCGGCGNVCPSGICHLGQCYTPTEPDDPTVCRLRDAVVNGGFDNATLGYGWDVVTQTGQSSAGYGFDGGASSSPNSAAIDILNGYLEIHQKVQLCPNTEYALTYNIRKVGGSRGAYCVSAAVVAGHNSGAKVLPPDGNWESVGPVFIQVGQRTPFSRPWDPITFSDDGVFAYANLGIGMSCSAASSWSTFRIDDVSIYPV